MRMNTRIDGLSGLKLALSRIADDAELSGELLSSAEAVRDAAVANLRDGVPPETRSGVLARSIFTEIDRDGAVQIGTPLDYGWHLEMGTETRPAYPWLETSFQDRRAAIVIQISQWLAHSARHAGR